MLQTNNKTYMGRRYKIIGVGQIHYQVDRVICWYVSMHYGPSKPQFVGHNPSRL